MGYFQFSMLLIWLSCYLLIAEAKVVKEKLTITWEKGAPNGGQARSMVKVNGGFPAPPLVFDEDDDVEVTVHNLMPQNTTVHWHGLAMVNTPWSDGVPGLSQTPIEPGQTFVYRFKASPAGQYWYHSHSRLQMLDGLYGSLLIRRKPGATAPWSLISSNPKDIAAMEVASRKPSILLVSDWSHLNSNDYFQIQKDSHLGIFCVDSILINGKGSEFCPGAQWMHDHQSAFMHVAWDEPETVTDKGCYPFVNNTEGVTFLPLGNPAAIPPGVQSGCRASSGAVEVIEAHANRGWVSLNFIDAATLKAPTLSVDQHVLWIYEVDGQFIEPTPYNSVSARAGERYSVMVKLDQKAQDYPIRVADLNTQLVSALAILRYSNSPPNLKVTKEKFITYRGQQTVPWLDYNCEVLNNGTILNRFSDIINFAAFPKSDPSLHPATPAPGDQQFIFHVTRVNISWETTMNFPYLYPIDHDAYKPLLYQPNTTEGYDPRYVLRTKNNTWVDLVVQVGEQDYWPTEFPHTLHKHGSKMWLIAVGLGIYNYSSSHEALQAHPEYFNLENPGLRDGWSNLFVGEQWLVLRYQVTNPGPFLFHCHIETHLAAGMGVAILDGVDAWPQIPPEYGIAQHGIKRPRG